MGQSQSLHGPNARTGALRVLAVPSLPRSALVHAQKKRGPEGHGLNLQRGFRASGFRLWGFDQGCDLELKTPNNT